MSSAPGTIHIDKYKETEQFFLGFFRFGWKANNVCFVAVYLFSQHFLQFDLSDQSGLMKHQVNNPM